jgi:8-oxo-dGTP pyrophosphatase MutT (NUDIX family)
MVQTHNRSALILPGGLVEAEESPAVAGRREVLEEVGLDVSVGRLLAVQHLDAEGEKPSSVQFVFDSEPVIGALALTLQVDEIASAHWLDPAEAVALHGSRGRSRLVAALAARSGGPVAFLDSTRTA